MIKSTEFNDTPDFADINFDRIRSAQCKRLKEKVYTTTYEGANIFTFPREDKTGISRPHLSVAGLEDNAHAARVLVPVS